MENLKYMYMTRRDDNALRQGNFISMQALFDEQNHFFIRKRKELLEEVEFLEDNISEMCLIKKGISNEKIEH